MAIQAHARQQKNNVEVLVYIVYYETLAPCKTICITGLSVRGSVECKYLECWESEQSLLQSEGPWTIRLSCLVARGMYQSVCWFTPSLCVPSLTSGARHSGSSVTPQPDVYGGRATGLSQCWIGECWWLWMRLKGQGGVELLLCFRAVLNFLWRCKG